MLPSYVLTVDVASQVERYMYVQNYCIKKNDSGTVPENLLLSIATRFRCFSLDFKLFESIISITLVTRILLLSKDKRLLN